MTLTIPIADLTILRAAARLGYDNAEEQDRLIAEISPTRQSPPSNTKENKHVRSR